MQSFVNRSNGLLGRSVVVSASALAMLCITMEARAATYQVGPGKPYSSLSSVAGNASYGAVRFSRSGTSTQKITIRGITVSGKRPRINGGTNTIEAAGNHYVFENLEITGGSSRCFFHHAHNITIRNSVVHDCPQHA